MYDVEIIGNKINPFCKDSNVWYPLGQITCMIAAGETDWIKTPMTSFTDRERLKELATEYLESCFHSNNITDKTKGYLFCRSKYPYPNKQYAVTKFFDEIEENGETKLQVRDRYSLDKLIEVIDLEMMYAVQNNISIFICKNCGKYFATLNAGAVYCDRILDKGQTCKYYGAKKTSAELVRDNELISFYEKTYQAVYYKKRVAKNVIEAQKVEKILKTMRKYRLEHKRGNLSDDEFRSLIAENQAEKSK